MRLDSEKITEILIKVYNQKRTWWKAQEDLCKIIGISSTTGRKLVKKYNVIHNVSGSVEYWQERCELLTDIWDTFEDDKTKANKLAKNNYHEFMIRNSNKHDR